MTVNTSLTGIFVGIYNKIKKEGRTYIPFTTVAKTALLGVYKECVKDGSVIAIEDLQKEEKENLVAECREQDIFFTNETLIQQCKCLHLIKAINDNS